MHNENYEKKHPDMFIVQKITHKFLWIICTGKREREREREISSTIVPQLSEQCGLEVTWNFEFAQM